jgi:hypothetical protein
MSAVFLRVLKRSKPGCNDQTIEWRRQCGPAGFTQMGNYLFLISYVQTCANGALRIGDCGPVWQMGVIAGLLLLLIVALAIMRWRSMRSAARTSATQ